MPVHTLHGYCQLELVKLSLDSSAVCMVSIKSEDPDSVPLFSKSINQRKGGSSHGGLFLFQESGMFDVSISSYLSSFLQFVERHSLVMCEAFLESSSKSYFWCKKELVPLDLLQGRAKSPLCSDLLSLQRL